MKFNAYKVLVLCTFAIGVSTAAHAVPYDESLKVARQDGPDHVRPDPESPGDINDEGRPKSSEPEKGKGVGGLLGDLQGEVGEVVGKLGQHNQLLDRDNSRPTRRDPPQALTQRQAAARLFDRALIVETDIAGRHAGLKGKAAAMAGAGWRKIKAVVAGRDVAKKKIACNFYIRILGVDKDLVVLVGAARAKWRGTDGNFGSWRR